MDAGVEQRTEALYHHRVAEWSTQPSTTSPLPFRHLASPLLPLPATDFCTRIPISVDTLCHTYSQSKTHGQRRKDWEISCGMTVLGAEEARGRRLRSRRSSSLGYGQGGWGGSSSARSCGV